MTISLYENQLLTGSECEQACIAANNYGTGWAWFFIVGFIFWVVKWGIFHYIDAAKLTHEEKVKVLKFADNIDLAVVLMNVMGIIQFIIHAC